MRAIILAALVGASSTFALAGPSDHASLRPGEAAATQSREAGNGRSTRQAPYALTGVREQRRVLEYRDVPRGRGQTDRVAFWTWVSE